MSALGGYLRPTPFGQWALSCLTARYRKQGGPCWFFRNRRLAVEFAKRRGIQFVESL